MSREPPQHSAAASISAATSPGTSWTQPPAVHVGSLRPTPRKRLRGGRPATKPGRQRPFEHEGPGPELDSVSDTACSETGSPSEPVSDQGWRNHCVIEGDDYLQSWCNSLGAGGPAMHGIALRYS